MGCDSICFDITILSQLLPSYKRNIYYKIHPSNFDAADLKKISDLGVFCYRDFANFVNCKFSMVCCSDQTSAFADMYGSTEIPITVYSGGKDSFARGFCLKNFPEIQQVELPRM